MDKDSADEVGELADALLAEHGIRLAVQLRGVAGDHLRVAGVVRVLSDECGFAASCCPSLVLRLFGGRAGIALEVALLLCVHFLRTATEDATVRVMKMFLTRGQGLSFAQFAGDTFDPGGCFKLCHITAWAETPHDYVIKNHLYSAYVSPCASSVCKRFAGLHPEVTQDLRPRGGNRLNNK